MWPEKRPSTQMNPHADNHPEACGRPKILFTGESWLEFISLVQITFLNNPTRRAANFACKLARAGLAPPSRRAVGGGGVETPQQKLRDCHPLWCCVPTRLALHAVSRRDQETLPLPTVKSYAKKGYNCSAVHVAARILALDSGAVHSPWKYRVDGPERPASSPLDLRDAFVAIASYAPSLLA
jgi:hypothetical protein